LYAFGSASVQSTSTPATTTTSTPASTETTTSTSNTTSSPTPQATAAPAQINNLTDPDTPSPVVDPIVNVNQRILSDTPIWGWIVTVLAVGIIVTVVGTGCVAVWQIKKKQKASRSA
jgi:hypothetical protein